MAIVGSAVAQPVLKWSQPPKLIEPTNAFYGWNEYSEYFYGPIVADDWRCTTDAPVAAVGWWGSFRGWDKPQLPPMVPNHFHIQFWSDVPAGSPGNPEPFSHPGQLLHEVVSYNYRWQFAGWDFDPVAQTWEACFRFDCQFHPQEYFYQDPNENVYWVAIAACYGPGPLPEFTWGWKTRPRDPGSAAPDAAVVIVEPLRPAPGAVFVSGYPLHWPTPNDWWDTAFELYAPTGVPKWSQPPAPYLAQDLFSGWCEVSMFGGARIVADDWLCDTAKPVTGMTWWGVFADWSKPQPPRLPEAFHFAIWTDVPAGPLNPFSHPGEVIWEGRCSDYQWEFAGWGIDPRSGVPPAQPSAPHAVFRFKCELPPLQWFHQGVGANVYWVSVAAVYSVAPPERNWGWLTRPRAPGSPAPDDGVVVYDPTSPTIGSVYVSGEPIWWPTPLDSWDLAFELHAQALTEACCLKDGSCVDMEPQECLLLGGLPMGPSTTCAATLCMYHKWHQPPTVNPSFPGKFYGWDERSAYLGPQFVGDDFRCYDDRPISDIHWWGSYQGWAGEQPPPLAPLGFHIGLWTDVPASPANPFSHPDEMIREWFVLRSELNERMVGVDLLLGGGGVETCFQYDFVLPQGQWFWQPDNQRVYWITIAALYQPPCNGDFDHDGDVDGDDQRFFMQCLMPPAPPQCWLADMNGDGRVDPNDLPIFQCQLQLGWPDPACCTFVQVPNPHPWGWTTRQPSWNDDAVRVFDPLPPRLLRLPYVSGEPIWWPNPQHSWDMAFVLTTPLPPRPICRGDLNCDNRVDFGDINPFVLRLSNPVGYFARYPYCPDANGDINGNGAVGFDDINPFVTLLTSHPLPIPCPTAE